MTDPAPLFGHESTIRGRRAAAATLVLFLAAVDLGCGGSGDGDGSRRFDYDVPVAATSPWPMMRRTQKNDGRSPLVPSDAADEPWRFATGKGIFSVPVIGHDGTVLVGSADRRFYALHPDGTLRWSFETGEIIDSAAAVGEDGTIHVPSADGTIYALDPDGDVRWTFRAHHSSGEPDQALGTKCHDTRTVGGPSNWFEGNVIIGPGGRLYAGNDNYRFYGLEADGSERFAFHPGPIPFGAVWSAATTRADGSAVFGALDTFLYSVSPEGFCQWRRFLGAPISASPAQSPDGATIYVGSWDNQLYALDAVTGDERWRFGAREHIYSSAAVAADGTVYFGSTDGTFYALSPEGEVRWTFDVVDPIRSSPSIAGDGTIFFSAGNGVLYALDPDGARAWSYDATAQDRNDLNSSPVLGRDRVYVGGEDGSILGVAYGYCPAHPGDPRCSTAPSDDVPEDGALLLYVTPGGRSFKDIPEPVQRGSSLTFRLIVRDGGRTLDTGLDPTTVAVESDPPADFELLEQAGGEWTNLVPTAMLAPATRYTVRVSGRYRAGALRTGAASGSFTFTTVGEPAATPALAVTSDRTDAFEIRNLAPYQPPVIVSLNQIGFDSVDFLASVIHRTPAPAEGGPGRAVIWMTSGIPDDAGTRIDPNTPSLIAFDTDLDGASFVMEGFGLTLVTGGPPIFAREVRIASQLDATGSFDAGTAFAARAGCGEQGLAGALLVLFDLCNTENDFVSIGTIRGQRFDGAPNQRPADVTVRDVRLDGNRVVATFDAPGYRLAEHLPAIVLVDDATGRAVQMDYRAALSSTAGPGGSLASTTLTLPAGVTVTPGAGITAIVVTDLFPLTSVAL